MCRDKKKSIRVCLKKRKEKRKESNESETKGTFMRNHSSKMSRGPVLKGNCDINSYNASHTSLASVLSLSIYLRL